MRKSFTKIYKNAIYNKNKEFDHLLSKILILKRKNKDFMIKQNKVYKKIICLESKNPRSVNVKFALSRMNLKENFKLGYINGLKKSS